MEKVYFYTVNFIVRKEGKFYTQVTSGTREQLEQVAENLKVDSSIESVAAVYVATISASDSSPFIVKSVGETNKEEK